MDEKNYDFYLSPAIQSLLKTRKSKCFFRRYNFYIKTIHDDRCIRLFRLDHHMRICRYICVAVLKNRRVLYANKRIKMRQQFYTKNGTLKCCAYAQIYLAIETAKVIDNRSIHTTVKTNETKNGANKKKTNRTPTKPK